MRKKRQLTRFLFLISNFFFIFVLFIVVFYLSSQLLFLYNISNDIDDNKFYTYNTPKAFNDYTEEEQKNATYYYIDYVEVNNEYLDIIYLNKKGLETGIPLFYQGMLYFFSLDDINLELNQIYTNNKKLETDEIKYKNYFNDRIVSNYFIDIEVKYPYICLVDNFDEFTIAIYDTYPPKQKIYHYSYNDLSETSFAFEGKAFKNHFLSMNKMTMELFILLSVIPIFFIVFAIGNFYAYYISKEQNDIIINHIYYASKKKLIKKYFFDLGGIATLSSVLGILLAWLIMLRNFGIILLLSIICCLALELLSIHHISKKNVKKNLNFNLWRKIND